MRRGIAWIEAFRPSLPALAAAILLAGSLSACVYEGPPNTTPWWQPSPWESLESKRVQPVPRGKRLKPGAYTVTVKRGDTLYSLARIHDVPLRSLIDANNVRPPFRIRAGQKLTIPPPRYHTVRRGETVYGISRAYEVDTTSLARINRIGQPYTIRVGQRLQLPADARQSARGSAASTRTASRGTASSAPRPRSKPALPAPPRRKGAFIWPVEGKVVSTFGPKAGGLHNDGVNIAVPEGTSVRASQAGVVAYAGNELKGYGNLLLIRHADGWVTAYAHNSKLLVKRGAKVTKGQSIALAGSTGSVTTPQVHFEVRKGTKAVNPKSVL